MSSSVMRARTRMWRMMVAIIFGGNLCGGMWQRPQFVRKRFSPSTRAARFCAAVGETPFDGAVTEGAGLLDGEELFQASVATTVERIKPTARMRISNRLVRGEMQTDTSPLQSTYWHCLRN